MNTDPKEYFSHLQELVNLEREEERKEFEKNRNLSLSERKKAGLVWYPVQIDREEFPIKGKILLSISRQEDNTKNSFHSGNSVSLFSILPTESKSLNGVITKILKDQVEVLFTLESVPEWVWELDLGLENFYDETSFTEMERALQILKDPKEKHTLHLRDVILGSKTPKWDKVKLQTIETLNPSQNVALANLLGVEEFGLVHGPPGTGKTYTLIHLAKEILEKETKVLLTAASNVAVDLLLKKSLEMGLKATRVGNPARIHSDLIEYTLDYKLTHHPDHKTLLGYKKEAEELFRKASKFKRNFGKKEKEERFADKKEARELIKTANEMENAIANSILEDSQIICATLIGITFPQLQKISFQTIIVDEATQCLEPANWIPILKTEKRIFFAGDHKQLPPTVKSNNLELQTTLFEKLMDRNKSPFTNLLNIQYRMQEPILHFSNKQFYDCKLESDSSISNRPKLAALQWISNGKHISFIDTAGSDTEEELEEKTESSFNKVEIELMRYLLEEIDNQSQNENFSIGVLSPYRAQVDKLKDSLEKINFLHISPEINTIDSFQGSERDVILISLVRSNSLGEVGFLQDYRRLNVAMTRAKEELILIGDSSTLSFNHFYKELLDYIGQSGSYRTIWEFPI